MGGTPGMAMDHGAVSAAAGGMDHSAHGAQPPAMGGMAGMDHGVSSAAPSGMAGMDHGAHGAAGAGMSGMAMGHGGMGGGDALASSAPVQGAVLAGSPSQLSLVFKSPVRLEMLQLFDSTGSRVPIAPASTGGAAVSARLPTLPPDAYEARWRASDAGGASLTGVLRFRVG